MNKETRKLKEELNVPWITKDGYLDLEKIPIDGILKQTLSEDFDKFRSGCGILQSMHNHERIEAGIYLLGLLQHYRNDLERLIIIVEKLWVFKTTACADALFSELWRVKSSNTTRRYINSVIKTLSYFPYEMVGEKFEGLAKDTSFSYRMRKKFRDILENMRYRALGY